MNDDCPIVSATYRLKASDGPLGGRSETGEKIRTALEHAGVEFIDANGGGPGVRLRKSPQVTKRRKAKVSGYFWVTRPFTKRSQFLPARSIGGVRPMTSLWQINANRGNASPSRIDR
jgi:hypothetical protein